MCSSKKYNNGKINSGVIETQKKLTNMLSGFNDFAVDFGEDLDHDDYESVDLDMFRAMKHEIMESTGKL